MTRWNVHRVAGGLVGTLALSGMLMGCPSSGVGDPCTPEDEYKENFAGFKLTEENIESRSFQCQTRICLVNHFQGRVSCPAGQEQPQPCNAGQSCSSGVCTDSTVLDVSCSGPENCPSTGTFDCIDGRCVERVCAPEGGPSENDGRCWVPGTNIPVSVPVCPQCGDRNQDQAVYCSCRCGLAEGEDPDAPENANFNFCDCPKGFECKEIRRNVGLGDPLISGKYCIKETTEYETENDCGTVLGDMPAGVDCKGRPRTGG
ncbi:MAG: hypothetical protein JRI23_05190 [Deltaproteobacteria bacterium]|nr:hypothetical protein [Deltaproteobacteria bacterium]MBW2530946.1 hypothetical protein [Deltaproteobacteria bacterium]